MMIHLKKDEAEYLLRVIDLGETFAQTHTWACDPKWRKLQFDREKLIDTLKEIAKKKDDKFEVWWKNLKKEHGLSNFEFCRYNLKEFMEKIEEGEEEVTLSKEGEKKIKEALKDIEEGKIEPA